MADLRSKILDACPLGVQILSILCIFGENLAKSYVGTPLPRGLAPHLGEILDPPLYWIYYMAASWIKTSHPQQPFGKWGIENLKFEAHFKAFYHYRWRIVSHFEGSSLLFRGCLSTYIVVNNKEIVFWSMLSGVLQSWVKNSPLLPIVVPDKLTVNRG